jgi:hypothetical protein
MPSTQPRNVNIRMDEETYQRISVAAKKKGLAAGTYMRMVVLESLEWDPPAITYQNPAEWTTTGTVNVPRPKITGPR